MLTFSALILLDEMHSGKTEDLPENPRERSNCIVASWFW